MGSKIQTLLVTASIACATGLTSLTVQGQEPVVSGDYYVVEKSRGAATVSLGGTVIPYKEVTLSAQLPGRVKYLAGIEGDAFDEGTLLVTLDDSELIANRRALLAQLSSAQAQLRNAGVQYTREIYSPRADVAPGGMGIPNLFDQMFVDPMESAMGKREYGAERSADLYSSGIRITEAQNAILSLQSKIQALDSKLRDARSIAPFDGVITAKYIEIGDTMQPGQPLLKFADVEYLQIEVDVPARLAPGLNVGMLLSAELDVGEQVVPVRVAQIFPMADPQRHTVKMKFDLPVGASAPGMYARVKIPDYTAPGYERPVIPASTIRYNGTLPGVYVLGEDGKPHLRLIRVGDSPKPGFITVLSGLRPGEKLLRDPTSNISSGWGGNGNNH